jgi:hypothetical protein
MAMSAAADPRARRRAAVRLALGLAQMLGATLAIVLLLLTGVNAASLATVVLTAWRARSACGSSDRGARAGAGEPSGYPPMWREPPRGAAAWTAGPTTFRHVAIRRTVRATTRRTPMCCFCWESTTPPGGAATAAVTVPGGAA